MFGNLLKMEKFIGVNGFINQIDHLASSIDSLTQEELKEIAKLDIEDVIFNVINRFYWRIRENGGGIDQETINKLVFLAEERIRYLKSGFPKGSIGRNVPGKMEYDTTLQSLRELKKLI